MLSSAKLRLCAKGCHVTEKTKTIGFRGTLAYRKKLAQAALDRGVKVQQLLERIVGDALGISTGTQQSPELGNNHIEFQRHGRNSTHPEAGNGIESGLDPAEQASAEALDSSKKALARPKKRAPGRGPSKKRAG
jgi:hypothetical protein